MPLFPYVAMATGLMRDELISGAYEGESQGYDQPHFLCEIFR